MFFSFSLILLACLPFSTQIKWSFVAVFGHRTGSAVLHKEFLLALSCFHALITTSVSRWRVSPVCTQGYLQDTKGHFRKGSLVVKAIPADLFTLVRPFLIVSQCSQGTIRKDSSPKFSYYSPRKYTYFTNLCFYTESNFVQIQCVALPAALPLRMPMEGE